MKIYIPGDLLKTKMSNSNMIFLTVSEIKLCSGLRSIILIPEKYGKVRKYKSSTRFLV